MTELRVCNKCGEEKPPTEFYDRKKPDGTPRRQLCCKPCEKSRIKRWRRNNPEAQKEIDRRARYKSVYGLDVNEVPTEGDCPICLRTNLKLVVDHCHKDGHVRDFICYSCNTLLGHVENKDKMKRVMDYLERTKNV